MTDARPSALLPAAPRVRPPLLGFAVPALLLAALGCGAERPPEASTDEAAAPAEAGRYTSPPGFEPAFTTVLPPDVRAEPGEVEEGPGDVVRFFSYAGGERHDSAFVQVFAWPPGQGADAAEEVVRTAAERVRIPGDRTEVDPVQRHPWATVEYDIRSAGTLGEPVKGWVALGRHGDRWFYVLTQAPDRLHRDFLPRAEEILANWRWADTGQGLGSSPPATVTNLP